MPASADLHLDLIPRRLDAGLAHFGRWRSANRLLLTRVYIAAILLLGLIYQLAYPITAGDTDMWYHLWGGKHFWATGEVSSTTLFSFLEPERVRINYYWGFQALLYKLHEIGGYQALILFRALMFFLLTGTVAVYLFHDDAWKARPAPFLVLLLLLFLLFEARAIHIRPHLFSFVFVATFIGILEHKPRWAPALPVLTVIWINTHGIEYVVGALICGAYFLETVVLRHVFKRRLQDRGGLYLASLLACAPAALLNPQGPSVFLTPFLVPGQLDLIVHELQSLPDTLIYPFELSPSTFGPKAIFTLLFPSFLVAWVYVFYRGRARISHTLLALGGVLLLMRGYRFIWEWALLSLPLLTAFAKILAEARPPGRSGVNTALLALALCLPFVTLPSNLSRHAHSAYGSRHLPLGVVEFLASSGLRGNLVMPPPQAGYAQWRLSPGIRIHSNMELPPFDAPTLYQLHSAYRDAESLRKLIAAYEVHFIAVDLRDRAFPEVIAAFDQFKPVFFGDRQVLYVNRSLFPEFVREFQLQTIDPFDPVRLEGDPNKQFRELQRVYRGFPEGERVNHALIQLLFRRQDYSGALQHAKTLVSAHPRRPYGHYWTGRILEKTGRCGEALGHFEAAASYADGKLAKAIDIRLGSCHFLLKDFEAAYEHLSRGINPFLNPTAAEDLYLLALSASFVGKDGTAISALEMLFNQADTQNTELRTNAQRLLSELRSAPPFANPGFSTWTRHLSDTQ